MTHSLNSTQFNNGNNNKTKQKGKYFFIIFIQWNENKTPKLRKRLINKSTFPSFKYTYTLYSYNFY